MKRWDEKDKITTKRTHRNKQTILAASMESVEIPERQLSKPAVVDMPTFG